VGAPLVKAATKVTYVVRWAWAGHRQGCSASGPIVPVGRGLLMYQVVVALSTGIWYSVGGIGGVWCHWVNEASSAWVLAECVCNRPERATGRVFKLEARRKFENR
jgi:hypothetical protein